jgi:hypothetical protein
MLRLLAESLILEKMTKEQLVFIGAVQGRRVLLLPLPPGGPGALHPTHRVLQAQGLCRVLQRQVLH